MKTKVLFIMNSLNCGGEENFVMNLYRSIDRQSFRIYFCIPDPDGQKQYFEDEIRSNHDRIFKIPSKSRHPMDYYFQIKKIITKNRIKVVHYHSENSMMVLGLIAAKRAGAELLISHSHNSSVDNKVHRVLHFLCRPLLNTVANQKYACSEVAGKWMYGNQRFRMINNGIDLKKYSFHESIRKEIRQKYGVSEQFVFGHVGRFSAVKNHVFLLQAFHEFLQNISSQAVLFLLGEGDLQKQIQEQAVEYGIEDKVFFMGNCNNVNEYLQAMDCFLFPSVYEGLPVSLVEAQASGLPCIVSDQVSKESAITSIMKFCPINQGTGSWVAEMEKQFSRKKDRHLSSEDEKRMKKYDIKRIAKYLERQYRKGY